MSRSRSDSSDAVAAFVLFLVIVAIVIVVVTTLELVRLHVRLLRYHLAPVLMAAGLMLLAGLVSLLAQSAWPVSVAFVVWALFLELLDQTVGPYQVSASDSLLAPWFGQQAA